MLTLDSKLILNRLTIKSPNLCNRFSDEDLSRIGNFVWEGYLRDKQSRRKWERRTNAAMDLALQIQKDKNFPWPGCSNIAFPLVTIATLQFHSRAYAAIIEGTEVVKCRVVGPDPTSAKRARAERISMHMSYQVLEQDKAWEEQHDRLLINLPVVGTVFIKSFYDKARGHNVSELVLARDLVIDYWAKSVEDCPRKTHVISLSRNEIHEKVLRGTYRDVLKEAWYSQPAAPRTDDQTIKKDNRQGVTTPQTDETTPFTGLEQHLELDLDGDGYAEPYIITIEETSHCVLRIVTGFDREADIERVSSGARAGKIIRISPMQYFTKYSFIPSPDGGIYDVGFGVLLGPLNEAVNTNVNQLTDAGTMSVTAGGFLGRGAKIRGGVYTFAPFGWHRVDASGDDLNKSIVPLQVREPSMVLFQLLTLLINYVNRISGSTDVLVGENPGQNQPAETTRTVVDQGLKIYSAIFKRVWRSMKEEFKKLYVLNGIYMSIRVPFGENVYALREDYLGNPDEVVPSADPTVTSDQMQFMQAQALKQAAMATPGYDLKEVEKRYLKALKIDGIDQVYPGPDKVPAPENPKVQVEKLKLQFKYKELEFAQMKFVTELQEEQRVNNAKIIEMQAQVMTAMATLQGDEMDRQINALNTAIGIMKARNDELKTRIDAVLTAIELRQKASENGDTGSSNRGDVSGMVAASDDTTGQGEVVASLAQRAA